MLTAELGIVDWVAGAPNITQDMVTDAILVGRALTPDGNDIAGGTKLRAEAVANHFRENGLLSQGGLIVCSANRTPAARYGTPWTDPVTGQEFPYGIPEAEGYWRYLRNGCGVPSENLVKQQGSFETVGDLRRGEDALLKAFEARGIDPADRVVMVAAQEEHLRRIMDDIAPHTMRLRGIGAVVPEVDPEQPDSYSPFATLVSRYVVHGIKPEQPNATDVMTERAARVWKYALAAKTLKSRLAGNNA